MKTLHKQQKTTSTNPQPASTGIITSGIFAIQLPELSGLSVTKILSKRGLFVW